MIDRGPSRLRAFAHKFARFAIVGFVGYLVDAGVLSAPLRHAARHTAVTQFDLKTVALPRWRSLFDELVQRRGPSVTTQPRRAVKGLMPSL